MTETSQAQFVRKLPRLQDLTVTAPCAPPNLSSRSNGKVVRLQVHRQAADLALRPSIKIPSTQRSPTEAAWEQSLSTWEDVSCMPLRLPSLSRDLSTRSYEAATQKDTQPLVLTKNFHIAVRRLLSWPENSQARILIVTACIMQRSRLSVQAWKYSPRSLPGMKDAGICRAGGVTMALRQTRVERCPVHT